MELPTLAVLAVLGGNALLLAILLLLWQVRKELQEMVRRVRVDSHIMATNTQELASAIRTDEDSSNGPVLAVTEEKDASKSKKRR